jgi:hypothetical protein
MGFFTEEDIVSRYTDEDGIRDGILMKLERDGKPMSRYIKLATTNLLVSCEYMEGDELNIPNVLDLIIQSHSIMINGRTDDWFYSGDIELPSGEKQKVFIEKNNSGGYTVMLPEDH